MFVHVCVCVCVCAFIFACVRSSMRIFLLLSLPGHFMYIESSTSNFFSQADLLGPFMKGPARAGQCTFSMVYHMYGSAIGSLQIQTVRQGSPTFFFNTGLRVLWTRSGNQGRQLLLLSSHCPTNSPVICSFVQVLHVM